MYDIYGMNTLVKAAEKSIMDHQKYKLDQISQIADSTSKLYNEEEYYITPCRFAKSGWKY